MKIRRAVKSAQIEDQLKYALEMAKMMNAKGLEVQELEKLMNEQSLERRVRLVEKYCKEYGIRSLAYHFPLRPEWNDLQESKKSDLCFEDMPPIFGLTKETIEEAALVGNKLDVETEIPIDIHLFGFVEQKKISEKERQKKLEIGEKRLLELKEYADDLSQNFGLTKAGKPLLRIVRENEPPEHGLVDGTVDFHPIDIARTAEYGAGTNLDFAHIWQCLLYWKNGKGEFPGVDLSKKLYRTCPDWESIVKVLKPSLRLMHMNDAFNYRKSTEGVEIGNGTLPHKEVIPLICKNLNGDIMGTYEIKYGHTDPESMLRSDEKYREWFGEKFFEYFE